jgi:hypothetical protein
MKNTLKNIIENDTSYNKSATRYLYKTHPELWLEIKSKTEFLPEDAKPKQRVWHILNEVYYRPTCPITGEYVKWWENRYLETISPEAAIELSKKLKRNVNTPSLERNERRRQSILEGFKSGKIKPKKWTKEESKARYEKIKQATLDKYGVHSTLLLPEVRKKQYETRVRKGITIPKEKRPARQLYYDAVARLTKISWNEHFDKINPNRLDRSKWDLDHIFSIQAGFRKGIPPYIIAHWTNLRMLEPSKNYSKGMRCDKTEDQLFEDVFREYKVRA